MHTRRAAPYRERFVQRALRPQRRAVQRQLGRREGLGGRRAHRLRPVTVVIAMRPKTRRGQEILNAFEAQNEMQPMQVVDDGTRRYRVEVEDADVDVFDPMLDRFDRDWRSHITNWRNT